MAEATDQYQRNQLAEWWIGQGKTIPAGILLHPVTVTPPPVAEVAKTKISILEVLGMEARRKQINSIPLEEIEWIGTDGKPFKPAKGVVDEWRFCGMTNIAFIETGFYKAPGKEEEDPRWTEGLGKFAEYDK